MMERNNSMLGKDSTIAKRKRIAIIAAVVIVVTVAIIGLAVGVSQKNKHHSDQPKQAAAPAASPPEKPVTIGPVEIPDPTSKASSASIERQVDLADKVDPPLLDSFLAALEEAASKAGPLVDFKLPTQRNISSSSLLMYLRDMNVEAILSPLLDFAEGKSPALTDIPELVQAVKKMLGQEAMLEWGKARAAAHFEGNETAALPVEELLAAAEKAGKLLPTPTVDVPALNNVSESLFPWQAAGGRKMLAPAGFVDICIPIVFHVLQYKTGSSTYFPGSGFTKAAQHMISRLNYAFVNSEYTTRFGGRATNSRIQFRLEAVLEVPAAASSYLAVTKGQWKTCDEDKVLLQDIAGMITPTYPTQKFINVIVCGDKVGPSSGYAWVPQPGEFNYEEWNQNHIFIRLDELHPRMNNRPAAFDRGGWTLAHEVGHYLGLSHPHSDADPPKCVDGDAIKDTPVTLVVQDQPYYYDLVQLCDAWRQGKPWYSNTTGAYGWRLSDMSSCDPASSPDPVFNVMEYTADSCSSYFTPAQVKYMQVAVPYYRPKLYSSSKGACAASVRAG